MHKPARFRRRRQPRHTFALLRVQEGEVRAEILPL